MVTDLYQHRRSNLFWRGKKLGSGLLINCNILLIFSVGLIFTDDEISEMVQEADIDGDQHISFEEFRDIFFESWKWCDAKKMHLRVNQTNLINLQTRKSFSLLKFSLDGGWRCMIYFQCLIRYRWRTNNEKQQRDNKYLQNKTLASCAITYTLHQKVK